MPNKNLILFHVTSTIFYKHTFKDFLNEHFLVWVGNIKECNCGVVISQSFYWKQWATCFDLKFSCDNIFLGSADTLDFPLFTKYRFSLTLGIFFNVLTSRENTWMPKNKEPPKNHKLYRWKIWWDIFTKWLTHFYPTVNLF